MILFERSWLEWHTSGWRWGRIRLARQDADRLITAVSWNLPWSVRFTVRWIPGFYWVMVALHRRQVGENEDRSRIDGNASVRWRFRRHDLHLIWRRRRKRA
jgi:hypothetical protein